MTVQSLKDDLKQLKALAEGLVYTTHELRWARVVEDIEDVLREIAQIEKPPGDWREKKV